MADPKDRRIGLARALSKLGYCSRSNAANLIREGRVTLNGKTVSDPETPSTAKDEIRVDGVRIAARQKVYLMLNKPRGIVTTASDEQGRETVYSMMKDAATWLAPVGRLDKASEGLLLLTNDSEWSARIAAPQSQLDKTYHVQIGVVADQDFIQHLTRGVKDQTGELLRAKQARLLRSGQKNCWLEITLDEGRNRHIRRMMEAMNEAAHVEILRLIRVAIGPLQLGNLAKGASRALTREEKQSLDRALGLS
jgi:23S rRNA pseudouridine2605 synthase